jgi:hypothetical protein
LYETSKKNRSFSMRSSFGTLYLLPLLIFALPLLSFSAAVTANGICEVGTCATPDSISTGVPSSGSFNFNLTLADNDMYNVSGTYSNSYGSNGTQLGFFPVVKYVGASASAAADTLSLDMLQNIFDNSPGIFDGTYTEVIPLNVPNGATATGQVFYDGQGVGLVGPAGPGFTIGTLSANLTGVTGNTLVTDYNITFNFAAQTASGTSAGSPVIPEPAQFIPTSLGLVALFAFFKLRNPKQEQI